MKTLIPLDSPRTSEPAMLATDWGGYVRLGWFMLLCGLGVFLLWAIFAPLDKGVPVTGTVIVSGQRQTVQNPNAGVVDKVLVKEGQQVAAGQVLVRLQQQPAQAVAGASLASFALASLTKERLLAELAGRPGLGFPASLAPYANDPAVKAQLLTQQQLLNDRQRAIGSELAALDAALRGLEQQRLALTDSKENKLQESQLADEQASRTRALVDKGFASAATLNDAEAKRARLRSEIAETLGNLRRVEAQLAETRMNKERRLAERQQEIKSLLSDAQRDIENFKGQLDSAELNLVYTDVKAPTSGAVLGLSVTTRGAVLPAGAKLMDIVPSQRDLIVEAQVPVNLIDQIREGLSVELMFSAFQQNKTPRLTGSVSTVGADRITDQRTGMPYFPVNVSITESSIVKLGNNELRPGMPVDVFIKTGERTFISYLIKPIVDRIKSAMAEE